EERLDISIQEGANARVGADEEAKVDYVGENGPATSEGCTILSNSDSGLTISESGWYAVTSSVEVPYIYIRSGANVHLILGDDTTLTLGSCISLTGNAKLTIYGQSKGSGSLIGNNFGVYVDSGTLTMYGGSISSNTNEGVYNKGTFTMHGGAVYGGTNGNAVTNANEFIMKDGRIVSNYAYGAGVFNYSGTFTMNGGSITGGTNSYGVYNIDEDATFILNEGSVTGGSRAISGTVKNTSAGTAWTNDDGTGDRAEISISTEGQYISDIYKYVQFPAASSDPSGITSWAELQEALTAAAQTGGTVTLTQHITCEDEDYSATSLTVPAGNAVTLDLAGHKIDANKKCSADTSPINTITVSSGANLTLVDSKGNGQICGSEGCGIVVYGTLSMLSGTITGNGWGVVVANGATLTMESVNGSSGGIITSNSNDGVEVASGGIFTMQAGEISGHTQGDGYGIWLGGGTLNLQGGELKNNTYGVIIETSGSTLKLQGAPVFSDNSNADMYPYATTITLTGALTYADPISIQVLQDSPQTLTSAYSTYMGDTDPAKYFTYYNNDLSVVLRENEAVLITSPTITFKNGDTELQSSKVKIGASPVYTGNTPTKADADWTGWSDETNTYSTTATLPPVSGEATYTATFQNTPAEMPTITTQPQDITLTYGYEPSDPLNITATVSSGHTLSYKWYSCKDTAKTDAQEISNATSTNLSIPAGLAAGDYYYYCTVTSTRSNGETTFLDSDAAKVTVQKREVTVSASDASDTFYSGVEQIGSEGYTFDNIALGQEATITYTPAKGTDVDTYEGVFSEDFKVIDDQGTDVTDNYKLTSTTAGKLTITARPIRFIAQSETKDYTGSEIEITTVTPDGLLSGHTHNVTFSAKGTDVGDYTGTITAKEEVVIKDGDTDVTKNYSVSVTNGTLRIKQNPTKELTVSLESKSYTYDGTPHALLTPATTNGPTETTVTEYSKDQSSWTNDLSSLTATDVADSCTIYVKATNTNYTNVATSEATLEIQKAPAPTKDITDSQKPHANDLKATGTEQPLVTPPTELPQGYTSVQYSLDGTTWQDEPPVAKDAGDYTVYVQYVGDLNHENYPGDPVSATIKAVGTLTFDLGGGTLNGSTAPLVIEASVGDTITIPAAPTLTGFTFKYWQGSEYYPGDKYVVEGSHTFTAVWQQNQQPTPTPTPTPNPTPQQPSIPRTGDATFSATSALALIAISALCLTLSAILLRRRKS
ncbi:MAG: InlB B-repeat-containing protein, partial [Coriobacteriales bacterium]|nr:InlB B-repeat-containing protein [Coriobacteriales bacterium]